MSLDHEAIRKAYPSAVTIDDGTGAFDANGVSISLDQAKIDSARITLDAENAAIKYKTDRTENGSTTYASFGDQLDMLYKDIVAGKLDTTGTWATHIKAVKDANPKP
jgi:lipopolysaccharide export system protein LptA